MSESLFTLGGLKNVVMLAIAGVLIYLGVKKDVEPLLLVPIGFGCLLANIPLGELMVQGIDPGARQVFHATGTPDAARELSRRTRSCAPSTTWESPTSCSRC